MLDKEYIDEEHYAILLSVLNEDLDKGNKEVLEINEIINQYFKESNIDPLVLRQSIVSTNTIEECAEQYNISVGKMTFIKNLIILNPEFEIEDLVNLFIEELILISRENGLDLSKIIDYDAPSQQPIVEDDDREEKEQVDQTPVEPPKQEEKPKQEDNKRNIISSDEARSIALRLANGKIEDFELDDDDGRLIYEIEIKANGAEHEIEIDGHTGKVLEHDIDD